MSARRGERSPPAARRYTGIENAGDLREHTGNGARWQNSSGISSELQQNRKLQDAPAKIGARELGSTT